MAENKFLVESGSGKQLKRRDIFPLSSAREMAYQILEMTGRYERKHQGNQRVQQALGEQDLGKEDVDRIVKQVLSQAPDEKKYNDMKKVFKEEAVAYSPKTRDIEKVKEEVIQDIYEWRGQEWFTSAQFKEMYESNYDRGDAYKCISRLKSTKWVNITEDIPDHLDASGYANYAYKLSDTAIEHIERNGGLTSDENEYYQIKKQMKPKAVSV